jgi:hypothetical protein
MHLPGYIQEGQEASYGYLLLGVYHRNSPGGTQTIVLKKSLDSIKCFNIFHTALCCYIMTTVLKPNSQ